MLNNISWKSEKRKIDELKPFERNPRQADEKQTIDLNKSLEKFNLADPLVINTDNVVIGGNFRLKLLREKGIEEIDVRVPNRKLTRKEVEELNLRLNKNQGSWNFEILTSFNENILKEVGFLKEEIDEAFGETFGLEIDDEFEPEKELNKILAGKERRCKEGDLWQLGEHRLYIGDAVKKESWENVLKNERFDFMFTDPPYRIGYGIGTRKQKTKNGFKIQKFRTYPTIGITKKDGTPLEINKSPLKSMKKYFGAKKNRGYLGVDKKGGIPEYDEWLSIANQFQNKEGANVMIFENWRNTVDLWQAIEKYWKIKNQIIWWLPNRCQGFSAQHRFFSKYDIAPLAGEGVLNEEYEKELDNYLKEKGQKLLDTYEVILYGNQGRSYWDKPKGTRWAKVNDHITSTAENEKSSGQKLVFGTKPIQILVPYIKILSPRNGIVMDPFGGSGSTMIACEIMKRKCRLIEISDIYGEVIINRWEKFTGLKGQKINS